MRNIKVFKIGGSILQKPEDFLKIAKNIINSYTRAKICIVTSAMKRRTDELLRTFKQAVPERDFWNLERFVISGEIEASILFESVFNFLKVKSKAVLPWMKEWPIFISLEKGYIKKDISDKRNFELLPISKRKIEKFFLPLFKKFKVVILPGFIAKDGKGRILTLGRGGSDISAVLIAELLNVKEVNFIKDTGGILNVDPKIFKRAKFIRLIDSDKLAILASSGAKVLNPIALKFTKKVDKIKVLSPELKSGTKVKFTQKIHIIKEKETFCVLTFIGENLPETPGILYEVSKILYENNISIYSVTVSDNLLSIYLRENDAEKGLNLLSPLIDKIDNLKILNVKNKIKKIVLRSLKFINEPGVIKRIVTPISREGINIWEILTVHTDIMIFIEEKDFLKTYEIIKTIFKREDINGIT